jgi:hypothetical protein
LTAGRAPVHNTGSGGVIKLRKILALALLGIAVQCAGMAALVAAPEIDPASGASAIALLTGAIVVIRGRRKS